MAIKITAIRISQPANHTFYITAFKTEYSTVFSKDELIRSLKSGQDYASGVSPFPRLEVVSYQGTEYIRSKPDGTTIDNLLRLTRF